MTRSTRVQTCFAHIPALVRLADGADHIDSRLFSSVRPLEEFTTRLVEYEPVWLGWLYKIRGMLARGLGLQHDEIVETMQRGTALDFAVGKMVGFFASVAYGSGLFWVGEASDRHLTAYIAVVAQGAGLHVVTIVHYRHWTGPVYFNLIRPFHHLVVYAMGKHAART